MATILFEEYYLVLLFILSLGDVARLHLTAPRKFWYTWAIYPEKSNFNYFTWKIVDNKLGLSCAKLRPALASCLLAFVWLTFTEAAYFAY